MYVSVCLAGGCALVQSGGNEFGGGKSSMRERDGVEAVLGFRFVMLLLFSGEKMICGRIKEVGYDSRFFEHCEVMSKCLKKLVVFFSKVKRVYIVTTKSNNLFQHVTDVCSARTVPFIC